MFTHVFVIIAICLLCDIQCFTIIHGYTLQAHFQYSIGELDTLFSIIIDPGQAYKYVLVKPTLTRTKSGPNYSDNADDPAQL